MRHTRMSLVLITILMAGTGQQDPESVHLVNVWLTTSQHKSKSAIGCQTNDIYIKTKIQICIN